MENTDKTKEAVDRSMEKSKILRAKSKDTGDKLNALKVKADEFIHLDDKDPKKEK